MFVGPFHVKPEDAWSFYLAYDMLCRNAYVAVTERNRAVRRAVVAEELFGVNLTALKLPISVSRKENAHLFIGLL